MSLKEAFASAWPWLASIPVAALFAVAVVAAARPDGAILGRRLRLAAIVLFGALALAGTAGQTLELAARRRPLPTPAQDQQAVLLLPDLRSQIRSLKIRINQLEHSTTMRMLNADTEKGLTGYLRTFGNRSAVVFCTPDDVEAYDYATQLTDLLKSAGWDAQGPEITTEFGDVQAMGVNVYNDQVSGGDAVKILLAGLAKFNIPFQVRVAPPEALGGADVTLFVGAQPIRNAAASHRVP